MKREEAAAPPTNSIALSGAKFLKLQNVVGRRKGIHLILVAAKQRTLHRNPLYATNGTMSLLFNLLNKEVMISAKTHIAIWINAIWRRWSCVHGPATKVELDGFEECAALCVSHIIWQSPINSRALTDGTYQCITSIVAGNNFEMCYGIPWPMCVSSLLEISCKTTCSSIVVILTLGTLAGYCPSF